MGRFVLIDRDGVINRRIVGGYVTAWDQFHFLPRALEGLALLARHQVSPIIVSNQACVGKGLLALAALEAMTRSFVKEIEEHGGGIAGVYYCLHRPDDGCNCRKPKPGLILQAQQEHGFSLRETYLIGDSPADLAAAQAAGCPGLLIAGESARTPEETSDQFQARGDFPDLAEAARFVIAHPVGSE